MAITPTSSKNFTFTKNASIVIKTYIDSGTGDVVSSYVAKKGDQYIEFTPAEFSDFVEAIVAANSHTV